MYVQYWTDYLTDSLAIDIHVFSAITVDYTKVLDLSWTTCIWLQRLGQMKTTIRHCGQNRLQISDCVLQLIPKVSRIHPGFSQQNETLQVKPPTNAQHALRSLRGNTGDTILEQWLQGFAAVIATVNMDFLISCGCEKWAIPDNKGTPPLKRF